MCSGQLELLNTGLSERCLNSVEHEFAMHLLSLYLTRQSTVALIVYKPVFTRDMINDGPYFSKLLLNAIYFTAAKYTSRVEVRDVTSNPLSAGRRFRRRIEELLPYYLSKSDVQRYKHCCFCHCA